MMKSMIALLAALLLSACVSIEFPNLVSDTVKAGKEIVGNVTGGKNSTDAKGIVFSNTVVADPNSAAEALAGQCLKELETQVREKLGKDQLAYKEVSKSVAHKGGKLVATCSVEII